MSNLSYIEELYEVWRRDPASLGDDWTVYFRDAETAAGAPRTPEASPEAAKSFKQSRVDSMLWAYRDIGYAHATLNPLGGDHGPDHHYLPEDTRAPKYEDLTLSAFGLSDADLDTEFFAGRSMQPSHMPLKDIVTAFRETYCRSIGVEFLHIQDKQIRRWLLEKMEGCRNRGAINDERRHIIMQDLLRTAVFEKALNRYFRGQKRFSIEGAEAVVPALHYLVDTAHSFGIEELVVGTAHRGRLSILNTILSMPPEAIFSRFEENIIPRLSGGSGDVKYHIGHDTTHIHPNGSTVHIRIPANASHLESIDGVVEGMARGRQDKANDTRGETVVPVIIHGDAAFCGQGVVAETLNLSRLAGYKTGGTIHVVINNQIGFTTASREARSSVFPTDVAKAMQAPIFHVNGDDPEALVYVMDLALQYRREFGRDCVIDMFCFRRYGHNEGDDPSFTHPYMYRLIEKHPGVTARYGEQCAAAGVMTLDEQEELSELYAQRMKDGYDRAKEEPVEDDSAGQSEDWEGLDQPYSHIPVPTGVSPEHIEQLGQKLTTIPDAFAVHPRLKRILERKQKLLNDDASVDWSLAESMAFGSLLLEGIPVRISGEDSVRGTFSQRHLAWWDVEHDHPHYYMPLNNLSEDQARLHAYDSPLSEYSVLAFEYGYSLVRPRSLTIWEAQFGDFANGAQVTIDNYIAAAEAKWGQRSGLVLLLPHGHEGQGPDHTSAHLERFLQLAARDNMEVCNATTPAQYFHLLRRQVHRHFRKPLIVMAPKSLLRHPDVISPLADLTDFAFAPILEDPEPPQKVERVLLCSGKVAYDLMTTRREQDAPTSVIIRMEQLHPFPTDALQDALEPYAHVEDLVWVQEENRNSGAWFFVREHITTELPDVPDPRYVGRHDAASTATGIYKHHMHEQQRLVNEALGIET